jgi:uncharacterized membrane protein
VVLLSLVYDLLLAGLLVMNGHVVMIRNIITTITVIEGYSFVFYACLMQDYYYYRVIMFIFGHFIIIYEKIKSCYKKEIRENDEKIYI